MMKGEILMIQTMRFTPFTCNKLSAGNLQALVINMFLAMATVSAIGAFATSALAQSGPRSSGRPSEELTLARQKARAAKEQFQTVKKLSSLGSASQKQLRDAELLKWLTLLDLSNLVAPQKKPQNSQLRAKLVANYRKKESKLEFQRAKTARDVAESRLKAVQGVSTAQRKIHVINAASSKYESAKKEHRLAVRLLKSGSISQAVMDQAKTNLEAAESELAEAKKSLGAKAVQVQ